MCLPLLTNLPAPHLCTQISSYISLSPLLILASPHVSPSPPKSPCSSSLHPNLLTYLPLSSLCSHLLSSLYRDRYHPGSPCTICPLHAPTPPPTLSSTPAGRESIYPGTFSPTIKKRHSYAGSPSLCVSLSLFFSIPPYIIYLVCWLTRIPGTYSRHLLQALTLAISLSLYTRNLHYTTM